MGKMKIRENAKAAKGDKESGTEGSEAGCGEALGHRQDDCEDAQGDDGCQVHCLSCFVAVEAIVGPRNIAANNEETDANIVKLVKEPVDLLAVTGQRVEDSRKAEAKDDSYKEDEEDDLLGELVAEEGGRGKVKEAQGKAKEGKAAQKVAPDVASFRMKAPDASETLVVAPEDRPVVCKDKLIVLHPGWKLGVF